MDSDKEKQSSAQDSVSMKTDRHKQQPSKSDGLPLEFFGPKGLEPTRYGDWEQKGRCTDFWFLAALVSKRYAKPSEGVGQIKLLWQE